MNGKPLSIEIGIELVKLLKVKNKIKTEYYY